MMYTGKLSNGKQFDSNVGGKPFVFTVRIRCVTNTPIRTRFRVADQLGAGEVIKGWDIGIHGMKKGERRRLTIPAGAGYGRRGTAGIPGNATLVFDIKCVGV